MRRIVFCAGLLLTAVGCQGAYSPFATYGPTQVPPPPTGCARIPDPYYRRSFAGGDRLSQRRFTSDQDNSTLGMADRRGRQGFSDGPQFDGVPSAGRQDGGASIDSGYRSGLPATPSFSDQSLNGQSITNQRYSDARFNASARSASSGNSSPPLAEVRVGEDLGWRTPEPAFAPSSQYVAPAGAQTRIPRPRFN